MLTVLIAGSRDPSDEVLLVAIRPLLAPLQDDADPQIVTATPQARNNSHFQSVLCLAARPKVIDSAAEQSLLKRISWCNIEVSMGRLFQAILKDPCSRRRLKSLPNAVISVF